MNAARRAGRVAARPGRGAAAGARGGAGRRPADRHRGTDRRLPRARRPGRRPADGAARAGRLGAGGRACRDAADPKFHAEWHRFRAEPIVPEPAFCVEYAYFGQERRPNTSFTGGIVINPAGSGTTVGILNHVDAINNSVDGLIVGAIGQTVKVIVSDSVIANSSVGIRVGAGAPSGGVANVMVRNSTIADNGVGLEGIAVGGNILVTRSTITGNSDGWFVSGAGVVTSYADNNIDGNTAVNTEPPNPLSYK